MESAPTPTRRRFPFFARILLAMLLGAGTGIVLGKRTEPLGQLGNVLIVLIKTLAAPLLFLAVVDAFLRTSIRARSGLLMLAITMTNAVLALAIGLGLSNALRPGDYMERTSTLSAAGDPALSRVGKIDIWKEITSYVPTSVVKPFLDNSIITIIILALMAGSALRYVKNEQVAAGEQAYRVVEDLVSTAFRAVEVLLGWVIVFIPLAVFGVVARTIGRDGFSPLMGLAAYVGVAVLGLALQVLIVYQAWLLLVARMPLRLFWRGARDAVVYALGASSSLATLPVTLRCLNDMGVKPQSARLAACVGTNLNNDGILLYEAMAVLFVAQVYGIHLPLGQQLLAAASCALAGIGIAAVPDAGLISLALVLATVNLPLEILPLLLTVDWLLSRCRAMTNVTSDILVAVLLDRFDDEGSANETAVETARWEAELVAAQASAVPVAGTDGN